MCDVSRSFQTTTNCYVTWWVSWATWPRSTTFDRTSCKHNMSPSLGLYSSVYQSSSSFLFCCRAGFWHYSILYSSLPFFSCPCECGIVTICCLNLLFPIAGLPLIHPSVISYSRPSCLKKWSIKRCLSKSKKVSKFMFATIYSLDCHEGAMLSTICSAKQKSLQMCAELRHCQRWVTNREGNEFHSNGPETQRD